MATEKRLIDANDLLEHFKFRISPESLASHSVHLRTISDCVDIARKIIKEAPTVDAVEVVHGRWLPSESMVLSAKCSECKGWVTKHSINEPDFKFCPNCGAKMDLKGE